MRLGFTTLAMLALLGSGAAKAQTPIMIVTSFGSASAADIIGRLLATEFTTLLRQPVVVKNTTGAAGTIAVAEVVRARPDGQTLLFTPIGPIAIQPHYMRDAGYQAGDLAPICMVNNAPLLMLTPPNSGMRTAADAVARARAAGGTMPFASVGPGTVTHLSMVMFNRAAGIELNHVTYRGPGDVMVAFQQGQVQLFNDHPSSLRPNGLHALGVLAASRMPDLPDIPTMREQGFEVEAAIWHGLFAPAATPAAQIARIEAACAEAVRAPAVIAGHERILSPIVYQGARQFAATVAADSERMRSIIEAGGLRQAE
jgi:tripartite-type tricarboxylate transporter receptor subunit TctC